MSFTTVDFDSALRPRPRQTARTRRHAEREHGAAADWGGHAPGGEGLAVQLMLRHRLDDDIPCGAEAVTLGPQPRHGHGVPVLLDPRGSMLREVGRASQRWAQGPVATLVNVADLVDGHLIGQVSAALLGSDWQPERLELILPEQALIDIDDEGILVLAALRDLGLGLTLDSFGAGIASMTVMRRLPLTGVKLARAIVRGLPESREDQAIARAVIGIAQAMGLTIIADGIETEQQRAFLGHCGCTEGQGALFGPAETVHAGPAHRPL